LHDDRHLVFFEPQAARNTLDFSIQSNQPFSAYPNLVFAPHVYTHIFTIDAVTHQNPTTATYPPDYDFAYRTADAEARSMGTALFVTEFGGGENVASTLTAGTMSAQERWLVGGTIWEWKGNCPASGACDPTDPGTWSVYQPGGAGPNPPQNGPIEPGRRRQLARISPRLVAGSTKSEKFDPDDGSFTLAATHDAPITIGDRDHETCIEAPPGVGGAVSVSGAAALDTAVSNPDGSRSIWVAPTGAGDYTVSVAATP
jgi:hypothetical protein